MKQEMISYIEKHKEDLINLNKFLYENPEKSYEEHKAYKYITDLLEKHDFEVSKDFLELKTSFYATKGNSHPKICFLCEYDAIENEGHITGHNLLTSTSVAAAVALGSIVEKTGGTVTIIGCPGEYLGGTKSIMVKQDVFKDIDIAMLAHPDIVTCESGTSSAIIPLSLKFIGNKGLSFLNKKSYTSLDGILLTLNILNIVEKGFPDDVEVTSILSNGGSTPLLLPLEAEAKFYIRAKEMDVARVVEEKIREIGIYVSKLIRIQSIFSLYEPENEELNTNRSLNRLFSHNLKETGIINIGAPRDINSGLSLGVVSKSIPSIQPFYSIIEDSSTKYGTRDFAKATVSEHGFNEAMKAALALAFTGYDIISNENLLSEVNNEFYKK